MRPYTTTTTPSLCTLSAKSYSFRGISGIREVKIFAFIFLVFLLPGNLLQAQCETGMENGDVTGNVPFGSSINWASPNRVEFSDDLYARAFLSAGDTTKYLLVSDFDYIIPISATIMGIEVSVERKADELADINDASVRLTFGGTIQGDDKAQSIIWPTKDSIALYGGPTDLWGLAPTPADIMDPSFGMVISVTRSAGPPDLYAYIDHITIKVYFNDPDEPCILPVVLRSFVAYDNGNGGVSLEWITSQELDNDYFTIEKSANGLDFIPAGVVDAAGAQSGSAYSYIDNQPFTGISFYRLRQTDFNGSTSATGMTEVIFSGATSLSTGVFPNPAQDQFTLTLTGIDDAARFEIIDLRGAVISSGTLEESNGYTKQIETTTFERGLYLVRINCNGVTSTEKVLLQ